MQLNSDYYETDFVLEYKGNRILIRNDGPEGESLYVNGELQDQNFGAHNGHLIGHVFNENHEKESIEVYLGGKETRDCMIYANGQMIHSHIPEAEHPLIREIVPEKKKRNNMLMPFIMLFIMVVFAMYLLPLMQEKQKQPEDPPQQETSGPVQNGNDTKNTTESAAVKPEYIDVSYEWNYGKNNWTYSMMIPEEAYEYYKTVERTKIHNYSYYVTDQSDDEYLAGLADKFKEAAEKENYSDLDMVKNIIFFVQNLNYLDDKVGTGYDEYPKFPLETLADQGGDCEDSAILLASLLRELGYGTVLLQFEDHMAVGVKGEDSIPGSYYEYEGSRYYYVETTSTGWDIGDVPDVMKDQPAKVLPLNR
jgi:predicted transglutaminase-like cysteine proteinase